MRVASSDSNQKMQKVGLLQKLNSTMQLIEASYNDQQDGETGDGSGNGNGNGMEGTTIDAHAHGHGHTIPELDEHKHGSGAHKGHGHGHRKDSHSHLHHAKSEATKKKNVLSKIQRALKVNYEQEHGSDEDDEEHSSETRGKKVVFQDSATNPQKLGRIPTNFGHRMLHAGGNMAIMRAKTPIVLTRAVNPSQERTVINSLISKSSYHSSDSMLGRVHGKIEYGGGGSGSIDENGNVPLYVLPDMVDVKSIADGGSTLSQYSLDEKTTLLRYKFRWQTIGKVVRYMKKEPLMITAFMKIVYKTMHQEIREYADAEVMAEEKAEDIYVKKMEKKRLKQLKLRGGMVSIAGDFADILGDANGHDDDSVGSTVDRGSNVSVGGDDASSMGGSTFMRRNKKKVTLSYTNKSTGNWVSRDVSRISYLSIYIYICSYILCMPHRAIM